MAPKLTELNEENAVLRSLGQKLWRAYEANVAKVLVNGGAPRYLDLTDDERQVLSGLNQVSAT